MVPTFSAEQLRFALARQLGQVLTPEVAAEVLCVAVANPLPEPRVPAGSDLVVSQEPRFYEFLNAKLQGQYEPRTSRLIARVAGDGRIRAVVLLTQPSRFAGELSVASDGSRNWLSRGLLKASFGYFFEQLGLPRIDSRVHSKNTAAIRMNQDLGFKHEGVRRLSFGDDDGILMGMLREECRWIGVSR